MMDKQCLRIWELYRLQHLDMPWWRNNYRRRIELHTIEVLQTPSVGEVWECPEVSSFSQFISCLGIGVCPLILIKKKRKKEERNCHGDNIVSINKNTVVSTLNVLLLTLNKALPGGCPKITRFVLILIPSSNKTQSCFMFPLSVLVYSSLDVCSRTHS